MTKHDNVSQGKIMKATEFVKKFGWSEAACHLEGSRDVGTYIDLKLNIMIHQSMVNPETSGFNFVFHRNDLKRLVESHELVESLVHIYKEIEVVREKASYCGCSECKSRLQAIADVEACQ
ncbi:hypothetical protein [Acinetobacter radioresistens]|uniref:hypothetical protein n=1 Tax=Acinetobacter radioresistens TaxID=40216 RepID=UPI0005519046|nr:hypothetical protein [Acinetobacter radioresistens]